MHSRVRRNLLRAMAGLAPLACSMGAQSSLADPIGGVIDANPSAAPASAGTTAPDADGAHAISIEDQIKAGQVVFAGTCSACHQPSGRGIRGSYPPLAGSDFLAADPRRAARIVTHGYAGKITVNGREFDSVMPSMDRFSDQELANVLTFVLNSWGNPGGRITAAEIRNIRTQPGLEARDLR